MSESGRHALPPKLIHDLRTPLNQIIGYSEMLTERALEVGQPDLVPDLEKVCRAGKRLLGMIDQSFDAASAEASEDVRESVRPATQFLAPKSLAKGLHGKALPWDPLAVETIQSESNGKLLVVDDDEGNRDVLSQRLRKEGYAVASAQTGREALKMLAEESFDLVLLDIMMPEMDGFEVLERLKANDGLQHVPVIMISALSETESVARCVEMGAEDYLTKPFNVILLRARLHACLEKKRGHDREVRLFEQLQQNYDRLQELETLRDDLTHMIVHDLRTPLTSVIAAMQTLEVLGEVNAGQREIVDIAVTESGVLLNMINSLLDVEKLESGTMALECSLFAPRELIASALAQVTPLAQEKAIALVQDLSAELPLIEGDEIKLQRVLVNLLGNALKFTPAGGTVSLRARQSDDKSAIEFFVKDTGEGIPLESFDRIFQKFGQVESRKAGRSMSTGLGLTFCKLAVEAHGGEIGVESMLGQGSTFWFTVPWASFRPEDSSILLPPDARSFRP
jgi:signal transduction histidine kinase